MFDPTLNGILAQLESSKIVLPAMQRPFVWDQERIVRLVDSLLRGFPIGTTLLWKTKSMQRFRRFQKDIESNAGITNSFESDASTERYLVLDGQQRLTSLFASFAGTCDGKKLYLNALSGSRGDKDPGEVYWECHFLTEKEAQQKNAWPNVAVEKERSAFIKFQDLTGLPAAKAAGRAAERAKLMNLNAEEAERLTGAFLQCATVLASKTALQVHLIDEDANEPMPIDEILEIFVRVNSGGLILQKSDLLMSLLDLKWNDIQPEIYSSVKAINASRPFLISRDDVLKSLLLASGSETRFGRLVADRERVENLALTMPDILPIATTAWQTLTTLLMDNCKITSERFFRGGHNSLLPFVIYLMNNPHPSDAEKRNLVTSIYFALMSGVFSSAEARMGRFARNQCIAGKPFPLKELVALIRRHYRVTTIDQLLSSHLDLTLNIAHGGITLNNNPEALQRDHIFPKSTLEKSGVPPEKSNHFANFHFLRGKDNLNKLDTPPHVWFDKPGEQPPYSDIDLSERLIKRELLLPGSYDKLIEDRVEQIRARALKMFSLNSEEFTVMFGIGLAPA